MHGPQMKSEKPWVPELQFFADLVRACSPFDKEYNHSFLWAVEQMGLGRQVRKKDWPQRQYAFMLDQSGDLKGNSLHVDDVVLKKLLSRPFRPTILLADDDDSICVPLDEIKNLTTDNWAIYE
ncbi:MAG TPA: hypothetical protein VE954_27390 [Oligoflexus sp.]|uniref:hypothetical protein n=1 Tax=Oligoflexus sp. TaxID=1971216 RepID=UPI002D461F2D|nr:hypothetical protein [Oligoflexus sp.]HYX36849.1 hypothetical protein [Oligoflexus sp.]